MALKLRAIGGDWWEVVDSSGSVVATLEPQFVETGFPGYSLTTTDGKVAKYMLPPPQAVKKLQRAGQATKSQPPSNRSLDRMLRRVERWNAQVRANALDELRTEGY